MLALLLKDLLSMKKTLITYGIFLLAYTAFGIYVGDGGVFVTLALVICIMLPINSLTVDEQCHWERIAACMPVSSFDMVLSKYLLAMIALLSAMLPAFAALALGAGGEGLISGVTAQDIILITVLGSFITALQIPFLLWLGVEKGRFVCMGIVLMVCMGVPLLTLRSDFISRGTERFLEHIYNEMFNRIEPELWVLMLLTLVFLAVSIQISIFIQNKKEIE
ncbi:MAG: ABC-2 transporter permease [Butyricicoccus pullicaecorum]|nr:ABC-2 transporter permease [Butyricicoccus pullicaecorum]